MIEAGYAGLNDHYTTNTQSTFMAPGWALPRASGVTTDWCERVPIVRSNVMDMIITKARVAMTLITRMHSHFKGPLRHIINGAVNVSRVIC